MRFREFATDSSESLMSIALLIGQQHQEGDPAMTMDAFLEKLDNAGINMNIESLRQAYETDSNVQSVVNELIRSNKLDGAELEFKPDANDDTPDERVSKMARKAVKTRESKMKGGSDFYKFMGYKDLKDLDKDNRQLPKVIAVEPFKNQGAQLKKLGNKAQGYGYYDEDASDRTSWVLRKNTKTTEGSRPGKLSKGHPNYKKQAAAIAISKQKAKINA